MKTKLLSRDKSERERAVGFMGWGVQLVIPRQLLTRSGQRRTLHAI